jgi:hypothetical protein
MSKQEGGQKMAAFFVSDFSQLFSMRTLWGLKEKVAEGRMRGKATIT